jgi:hypothetical protein
VTDYTDVHADDEADLNDHRIRVDESGYGIDIVRERYGLVRFDAPKRYYGWFEDETFHVRADNIDDLLSGIREADVDFLRESLEQLQRAEAALSEGTKAGEVE